MNKPTTITRRTDTSRSASRRWLAALAVFVSAALLAASCSSSEPEAQPAPTAETQPAEPTAPATAAPVTTTTAVTTTEATVAPTTTAAPATVVTTTQPPPTTTEATEPEEPSPPREAVYENKSPDSVFPDDAYYDHTQIRELFPDCPPPRENRATEIIWFSPEEIADHITYWDSMYEGWDTESREINGYTIATGWWTDRQLARYLTPAGLITAASARQNEWYYPELDHLVFWPAANEGWLPRYWEPHRFASTDTMMVHLYRRAVSRGYVSNDTDGAATVEEQLRHIRDSGMPGNQPNPERMRGNSRLAGLLWEWTLYRTQWPPTTREPAHFPMRSLLEAREPTCVVAEMLKVCSGQVPPDTPLLKRWDNFGQVLWSLICPEKINAP